MTSAEAPATRRSGPVARGWRNFRRWRRGRPFWGGLFTLLAGLQIYASSQLTLGGLQLRVGLEGALTYLIPAALILAGILVWLTPAQRIFYGVLTALISVYALIGVNLGGFFLGTIFGIIGGALSASWTAVRPVEPPVEEATEDAAPEDTAFDDSTVDDLGPLVDTSYLDERRSFVDDVLTRDGEPDRYDEDERPTPARFTGPLTDVLPPANPDAVPPLRRTPEEVDSSGGEPPGHGTAPRRGPRLLSVTLVPVVLVALAAPGVFGLAAGLGRRAAAAPCVLAKPVAPAEKLAPPVLAAPPVQAAPAAQAPAAQAATPDQRHPVRDAFGQTVSFVGGLLGAEPTDPPTEPPADPSPSPSATDPPAPSPSPSIVAPPAPPVPTSRPRPTTKPTPCPAATAPPKARVLAPPNGLPPAAARSGRMTGTRVTMTGLTFDGVVDLPTRTGTVRVLQFSMTSSTTDAFELRIPESNGSTTILRSTALTVSENVKFYTDRFRGKAFGVLDLTFTPDSPPPPTPADIFFTDPDIQLVLVSCGRLTAPDLRATISG